LAGKALYYTTRQRLAWTRMAHRLGACIVVVGVAAIDDGVVRGGSQLENLLLLGSKALPRVEVPGDLLPA
jgi:hypothetical protein